MILLRFYLSHQARERNRLADVVQAADPLHRALHSKTEAGVGHRAVTTEIEVPLEGLARQLVLVEALLEERQIVLALRAADDLAVAFGRDDVERERDARVGRDRVSCRTL